jgi:23S rRNA A2030 N6-methylase RlmJ
LGFPAGILALWYPVFAAKQESDRFLQDNATSILLDKSRDRESLRACARVPAAAGQEAAG